MTAVRLPPRWGLVPDGSPMATHSSVLLPVRCRGAAAMLKVARLDEEARGGRLMAWYRGDGAARVLARQGRTILLERGGASLAGLADDDAASRILCAVAARLHAARPGPPPRLVGLARWFRALGPAAATRGGTLVAAHAAARDLLAAPREVTVLHGDLHHMNVLDFGPRGWLAIDPKGLLGERGFEFATLFRNPVPGRALAAGRLDRQLAVVAGAARLEPQRLLRWILAVAGLSAAWHLADGGDPATDLSLAELARARLGA